MKKYALMAALGFALISPTGCAVFKNTEDTQEKAAHSAAVTPYSADSLRNYKIARDFSAQGRYELAREHYLLALASTSDPYLQDALAQELESIDMIIRSLR